MLGAGEIAQVLSAVAVCAKDSDSVCSTYKAAHNDPRIPTPSSDICRNCPNMVHGTHAHTHAGPLIQEH